MSAITNGAADRPAVVSPAVDRRSALVRAFWLAAGACGAASGCGERPRAPALRDGPVYRHRQLGFRFMVPDGWNQTASADVPPGAIDQELCVTQFRVPASGPATLEVLCFDPSYAPNLDKYHADPSHGVSDWQLDGEPRETKVGELAGRKLAYRSSGRGGVAMVKEATCFTRDERVVCFIGLAPESDVRAREQLQRAVRTLVWE